MAANAMHNATITTIEIINPVIIAIDLSKGL